MVSGSNGDFLFLFLDLSYGYWGNERSDGDWGPRGSGLFRRRRHRFDQFNMENKEEDR
jgi:hypothetical protein